MVQDLIPGPDSSFTDQIVVSGDRAYFVAKEASVGTELWSSDGATITLESDIRPGEQGSDPGNLFAAGNELYFSAYRPETGEELYRSGPAGTALIEDILPGTDGSNPDDFVESNGTVFFTADDGVFGNELWKMMPEDLQVNLKIQTRKITLTRRGAGKVKIACPANEVSGPCTGTVTLATRGKPKRVYLKADFSINAGKSGTVRIKIKGKNRKQVNRNPAARKVRLSARVTDSEGNRKTVTRNFILKVAR